jgi:hypothetical protein
MKPSGCFIINKRIIIHYIFLLISAIYLEGCAFTWIGRSVGGDMGRPRFQDERNSRIVKVSPDHLYYGGKSQVEIHMTDSSTIAGKFIGYKLITENYYGSACNLLVENTQLNGKLKNINNIKTSRLRKGSFQAFYGKRNFTKSDQTYPANLLINTIGELEQKGKGDVQDCVEEVKDSLQIPPGYGACIRTNMNEKIVIPCEEIAYARCQKGERNGKLIGMAIGIMIDTVIVLIKSRDEMTGITSRIDF